MAETASLQISLRTALVALLAASLLICGLLLHVTWWRTSTLVSRNLVEALGSQITEAAETNFWGRIIEVRGQAATLRESIASPDMGERALVASAIATPAVSWLVQFHQGGETIAVRNQTSEPACLFRLDPGGRLVAAELLGADRTAAARSCAGDIALSILDRPWARSAKALVEPDWIEIDRTPDGAGPGVAYVVPAAGELLVSIIGYDRFARILGEISVGRTGRTYVIGPDGQIVIAAHTLTAPRMAMLDQVALAAGARITGRPAGGRDIAEKVRLTVAGKDYAVGLSPLWFKGWQLAVIVPEADFLSEIDDTIRAVAFGLAGFVGLTGLVSVFWAQRLVVEPVAHLVQDLAHVEHFELDRLVRRPSRLREIDRLSEAIVRMGSGLSDFAKFIPTDLVRGLVAEGIRLEPGGSRREVTLLFADLAGFTSLSEQLGDGIVPIVGRYLEVASQAVARETGTVDKFIGDAVMAFWGAPRADAEQALHACRAALAIAEAVGGVETAPGVVGHLRVRIGLHSGPAIVGNIGARNRLNYTALGDTVNLASRLEAVNKIYGTTILIGPTTRAAAGRHILVREIDTVAVYGRAEGVVIFELLGVDRDEPPPAWIGQYEAALGLYREARFSDALAALAPVLAERPEDGPALRLSSLCRQLTEAPTPRDWRPVNVLDMK